MEKHVSKVENWRAIQGKNKQKLGPCQNLADVKGKERLRPSFSTVSLCLASNMSAQTKKKTTGQNTLKTERDSVIAKENNQESGKDKKRKDQNEA